MVFRIGSLPQIRVGDKTHRPRVFRVRQDLSGTVSFKVNMGEAAKRTGLAEATLTTLGVTAEGINVSQLRASLEAKIPDELKPKTLRGEQTTAQNVLEAVVGRIAAGTEKEDEVFERINIVAALQRATDGERIPLAAAYIREAAPDPQTQASLTVDIAHGLFVIPAGDANPLKDSFVAEVAKTLYRNNMTPRRIFAAEAAVKLYSDDVVKQAGLVTITVGDPRYESIALREIKQFPSAVSAARRIKDPMERAIQMRANAIAMAEARCDGKEVSKVFQLAIEAGYLVESPKDKTQLFESIAAEMAQANIVHTWVGLVLKRAIKEAEAIASQLEVRNRLWAIASMVDRLNLERPVAEIVLRAALEAADRISDGEAKASALAWIRREQDKLAARQG